MFSISYGADVSVETMERKTAREALALAEEYEAAGRPHVVVTDLATMRHINLEELADLAEAGAMLESR
jgi:hypothetical protein